MTDGGDAKKKYAGYVIMTMRRFFCTRHQSDKPRSKWSAAAICLAAAALVLLPLHVLIRQAKEKEDAANVLPTNYDGPTVAAEPYYFNYYMLSGENRLASLDEAPTLWLTDNFPALDGATAFFPIYAAIARTVYQTEDSGGHVKLSRTSEAYNRLIRGETDLIFVLQPSDEQEQSARDAGVELRLTPIAKEAFVFFVSERNPVSDLSIEQIQGIYLKKITNWSRVGGGDTKILPFQRPENSGSQTTMIKEVMKRQKLPAPLQVAFSPGMGGMIRGVAAYRDYAESIGYSFRFFTKEMVRYEQQDHRQWIPTRHLFVERPRFAPVFEGQVKILYINGVAPTVENIRSGAYPFTEDIYAVTAGTENPRVQELIDWILSPQGQRLIEKTGYVGVN
jgi:phosphate transport system substrate-binding protein